VSPKQAAAWLPVALPLLGSLCTGVSIKVEIASKPPEERSERVLNVYRALPEVVQNVLANSEPWEAR
jgi:hypothetical protein